MRSVRQILDVSPRTLFTIAAVALSAVVACTADLPDADDPDGPRAVPTSASTSDATRATQGARVEAGVLVASSEGSGLPAPQLIQHPDEYALHADQLAVVPGVGVDFADAVILMLAIPKGAGCAKDIRFDTVVINSDAKAVHGEFTTTEVEPGCTGILRSERFFVAVDRDLLPSAFALQSEAELSHPQAVAVMASIDD